MTTSRTTSVAVALTALVLAAASTPSQSRPSAPSASAVPVASAPRVTRGSELAAHPSRPARQRTSAPRPAYGWPVKPFRRQHPIRGFFGDPRIANHGQSRQFHFGVDTSARNGTPVYATLTGRVYIHPLHSTAIAIVGDDGVEFSYWHVIPVVRTGDRAVAYETVIGRIEEPYGHVHFSERRNGRYVNPLRPGALGPYADDTQPIVRSVVTHRR
ncbi:MAG TPA: peptidoglycan DD-metalloendopeptidase family protein [Gaiellaceae bacterium]|nr:peptidoglycan DD-metalloendopeptidase family protein [Gaiellaceae bacterium]